MKRIAALLFLIALIFALAAPAQRGIPVEDTWSITVVSETMVPGQGLVTVIATGGKHFVL